MSSTPPNGLTPTIHLKGGETMLEDGVYFSRILMRQGKAPWSAVVNDHIVGRAWTKRAAVVLLENKF